MTYALTLAPDSIIISMTSVLPMEAAKWSGAAPPFQFSLSISFFTW